MIKRISMLFAGLILGVFGTVVAIGLPPPSEPELHPDILVKNALDVLVPFTSSNAVNTEHTVWIHRCCDCGLTHRVLTFVVPDRGIRFLWWRDEAETRKHRFLGGLTPSAPFSAEFGRPTEPR